MPDGATTHGDAPAALTFDGLPVRSRTGIQGGGTTAVDGIEREAGPAAFGAAEIGALAHLYRGELWTRGLVPPDG